MGKIIRFPSTARTPRWTRSSAYRPPIKRRANTPQSALWSGRGFIALLIGLPLAAFTAVLLLPLADGPEEAGAKSLAMVASDSPPRSAATLDAEQPEIAAVSAGSDSGAGASGTGDRERARFGLCSGAVRVTCVVDGDTIWYRGTKIRIADLDTPEVSQPACANEAALGRRATLRLQALLNAGPFSLEPNPEGRSEDKYGRTLMLVTRDGASLGAVLVREGLAEEWGGPKRTWC
ncbi:MAG: thermonuclease family protein [Erythrobacter sp.]